MFILIDFLIQITETVTIVIYNITVIWNYIYGDEDFDHIAYS